MTSRWTCEVTTHSTTHRGHKTWATGVRMYSPTAATWCGGLSRTVSRSTSGATAICRRQSVSSHRPPSVQRTAWVKQASCVVEPCEAVGRLGWELREVNEIGAGRVDLENYFDENFNNKAVEDKGFGMEKMTAMCTDIFREEMDKCRANRSARAQEARRLGHHKAVCRRAGGTTDDRSSGGQTRSAVALHRRVLRPHGAPGRRVAGLQQGHCGVLPGLQTEPHQPEHATPESVCQPQLVRELPGAVLGML